MNGRGTGEGCSQLQSPGPVNFRPCGTYGVGGKGKVVTCILTKSDRVVTTRCAQLYYVMGFIVEKHQNMINLE